MAFIRFPLIGLGIAAAYLTFVLRGYSDALLLSLLTPTYVVTVVNLICLLLLARLVRREQFRLRDLIGFDRARIGRDAALGILWLVVLNIPFLVTVVVMVLLLERPGSAEEFGPAFERVFVGRLAELDPAVAFPTWLVVAGAVCFSLLNPVVEEMQYRGYVQPRLEVLSGHGRVGISLMAAGFALQHTTFAVTWPGALVYAVSFFVWGYGAGLVYRRQRRLVSLIISHFVINVSFGLVPLVFALSDLSG